MINERVRDKLIEGYINGQMELTSDEATSAIIFVVNYQVYHDTKHVKHLEERYGRFSNNKSKVINYSLDFYRDLVNDHADTEELFWKMMHTMQGRMIKNHLYNTLIKFNEEINLKFRTLQ